jgi:transcription antitermination factor NusG
MATTGTTEMEQGDQVSITEGPNAGKTGRIASMKGTGAERQAKVDLDDGGTVEVVVAHLKGAIAGLQDGGQGDRQGGVTSPQAAA